MSSLTRFSRALRQSNSLRQPALASNTTSIRHFTARSSALYPRKDSQDKDSMNTEPTEYSKSGTDDEAARQEDAAFDPSKTSPESQKKKAGEGNEGNPLEVSPANPEVSKPRGQTEGGAETSKRTGDGERKQSGAGSPNKQGTL